MIINNRRKYIFLHNPKVAGTAITKKLLRNKGSARKSKKHTTPLRCKEEYAMEFHNFFKFAFVRNPWDRMVSHYHYHRQKGIIARKIRRTSQKVSFSDYIKDPQFIRPVYRQCNWTHIKGEQAVNFIGYYENLDEDFKKVGKMIGLINTNLKHVNASKHKDYREYYTEETKQIVADLCFEDIELFGYNFEGRE